MYSVDYKNNNVYISNLDFFDISKTLDCGQAFRWEKEDNIWHGVAYGKYLKIEQNLDTLTLYDTTKNDFENIWRDYFDLNTDYGIIEQAFSTNEVLSVASRYGKGIRILRQEPWETLCSFIISQNNNIPRIKGIISRLCENFGENKNGYYTFPDANIIADLSLEDLSVLRSGFRAKYILDAAKKVASGQVDFNSISKDTNEARLTLMQIYGVGEKVADCTLLFGLGHADAFPKDVWIKRAMTVLFDGQLPTEAKIYAGIAQQYIFYYARETKLNIDAVSFQKIQS